jgi:asparagine synthase (glutamine-hydrolysing)
MCGIFAYIQKGKISAEKLSEIEKSFALIKHRGPDHTSSILLTGHGSTVYLGFHRLVVVGLSNNSNSFLSDQNVYLTCNGEIYNYQYLIKKYQLPVKTDSDCEVILQLYLKHQDQWSEIMNELDGVFAFVLYDHRHGLVFASRDRIGVRPIFVGDGTEPNVITFASEGKAILTDNGRPFLPATLSEMDLDDWHIRTKLWITKSHFLNVPYDRSQVIIRELFMEAVGKRLIADRPIGFLLSGGLDSSLVASIANILLDKQITTFSIGLPNSPDLIAAREVAEYLNSDHHEVIISTDDILQALPSVIYADETYDVTTIRASIPMYLLSKYIAEKTDIKVIFSGEGADELLGGYLYFHKAPDYKSFQAETHRLLNDLYLYDVLRGDRTTAAHGLEIRVPFLDATLLSFVANIDPAHKMPAEHGIEKAIFREAFIDYLPNSIINRQKQAFSDGIGYNSVSTLKKHASKSFERYNTLYPNTAHPTTDEEHLYYNIFNQYYAGKCGLYTRYYWMPKWCGENITDPSATVLDIHKDHITM